GALASVLAGRVRRLRLYRGAGRVLVVAGDREQYPQKCNDAEVPERDVGSAISRDWQLKTCSNQASSGTHATQPSQPACGSPTSQFEAARDRPTPLQARAKSPRSGCSLVLV